MHYTAKFREHPPTQPKLFQLYQEAPGGSRSPCLGEPRGTTGEGPAAHHGAARRRRAHGPDSGHSSATDEGPAGGFAQAPREADSRAGYRSARDLIFIPSLSQAPGSFGADGRTVGGSSFDRILFFFAREQNVDIPVPSRSGRWERSSRFTPWTEFNSVLWSRTR